MNKYWEVEIQAVSTVFVAGAESEEQALQWAQEETRLPMGMIVEIRANELTNPIEVDSCRRHADEKVEE